MAYDKAIFQIKRYPNNIVSGEQLSNISGIGKGIINKINTILSTSTLPIIKEKNINKALKSSDTDLVNIFGFGPSIIKKLRDKGITTVKELFSNIKKSSISLKDIKFTKQQEIGLKYYDYLIKPISRSETEFIYNRISEIVSQYNLITLLAGSYPSGKLESKDVDLICIYSDSVSKIKNILSLLDILKKNGLIIEIISKSNNNLMILLQYQYNNKNVIRHLDLKFINKNVLPYTYMHFTSGAEFNKQIRYVAKKMGYKLNEYGLIKSQSSLSKNDVLDKKIELISIPDTYFKNFNKETQNKILNQQIENEKKIFEYLKLKYIPVHQRN